MRDKWSSRSAFILAAVGSAAGLGNIWRFPYQAANNGGGAFLIPYFIALFVVGIPLLVGEFALGQKFRGGAPKALRNLNEKLEVFGWFSVGISFLVVAYYSVILAWVFDYLWYSLKLAWTTGAGAFFFGEVLKISSSPFEIGGFSTPVIIGLIMAWVCIYLSIKDGASSVGKIVKFTVVMPIVLLAVFTIRVLFLDGAVAGVNYYLDPDFSKLSDISVWTAAFGQILFSLSLGYGIMIAYASYMPKNSDITLNATITALANSGVSFLAGFAIFGTLGHIAASQGVDVASISGSGGVGLAFVVYPEAITKLPFGAWGQVLFALSFFIMLLTLGIDSAFSLVEAVVAAVVDKFEFDKKKTTIAVVVAAALLSLIFATKAGLYWLDIVDYHLNNYALLPISVIELIILITVFKVDKLREFVNAKSDIKVGKWFDTLVYVATFVLGGLFTLNAIKDFKGIITGTTYENYPLMAIVYGGIAVVTGLVILSVVFAKFVKGANGVLVEEVE
jgi:NSS family neurotransmitter:Na+ symporter